MNVELRVFDDADAAAAAVAEELARAAGAGAEIALAGGSTPKRAYELTSQTSTSWARAGVWWGDERCVPPSDERSNYRLFREALLDRVSRPPATHRIRGELEPEAAAALYNGEIHDVQLDLVLLGIGPDGHTASLFPNSPALDEAERAAVAVEPALEPFVPRVTLTPWKLAETTLVLFLVTGPDKAEAVERAFGQPPSPETPASLIRSADGRTVAVLDRASAARLSG
jgi:6-phosphogluconolactonase